MNYVTGLKRKIRSRSCGRTSKLDAKLDADLSVRSITRRRFTSWLNDSTPERLTTRVRTKIAREKHDTFIFVDILLSTFLQSEQILCHNVLTLCYAVGELWRTAIELQRTCLLQGTIYSSVRSRSDLEAYVDALKIASIKRLSKNWTSEVKSAVTLWGHCCTLWAFCCNYGFKRNASSTISIKFNTFEGHHRRTMSIVQQNHQPSGICGNDVTKRDISSMVLRAANIVTVAKYLVHRITD